MAAGLSLSLGLDFISLWYVAHSLVGTWPHAAAQHRRSGVDRRPHDLLLLSASGCFDAFSDHDAAGFFGVIQSMAPTERDYESSPVVALACRLRTVVFVRLLDVAARPVPSW